MGLDRVMDVELDQIRDFLAQHQPYQDLPPEILDEMPARLQVAYFRRGAVVIELGARNEHAHILRSGAVDILDSLGELADRDAAGDTFGLSSVLTAGPSLYRIVAHEDSLCYLLPAAHFRELMAWFEAFAEYLMGGQVGRFREAVAPLLRSDRGSAMLRTELKEILRGDAVTAARHTPVDEAAP